MSHGRMLGLGLLTSLLATPIHSLHAQPIAAPAAPAAAAAAPANLWSFLCPTPEQRAACKTRFCNSALGKLASGAAGPMSAMTGGLLADRCQKNAIENGLKKSADDPDGLAARVKADEEEAKIRRANVRFLATVDCNYWPEAIDVLRLALRKDRSECVRFEAALALRNGCCCNATIVEALKICVMGTDKDGCPPERSDRVRAAAADALTMCVLPEPIADPKEKTLQKTELRPNIDSSDYYKKIAQMPREQVVAGARDVLVSMQKGVPSSGPAAGPAAVIPAAGMTQRPTSVSGIVANAFAPTGGPRQPFFSGLTKSLTGRQDNVQPSASPDQPLMLPPVGNLPSVVVSRPGRP